MSNTRHAQPSAPISQERYLSSPEYAEVRGISGNAVTAKAALMAHPAKRSLLFFLQAISLKTGGLQKFTREFLEMFSDRIGTPSMRKYGCKPGCTYTLEQTDKIREELGEYDIEAILRPHGETSLRRAYQRQQAKESRRTFPVQEFIGKCVERLQTLPAYIVELCINPALQFQAPGESAESLRREKTAIEEADLEASGYGQPIKPWENTCNDYFHDIIGALFEYQRRYEQSVREDFVKTEVGRLVFETLDFGLVPSKSSSKKIVVIEGNSRIGKTTAAEAWCNAHLGHARFISLSGITHKTGLFRALAKALGIGSSYARSSTEMQTRIEDLLQRSQLMIVMDEAHALFSSAERVYSRPELIDWIDTALANHGVPTGLLCTPQFALRMARAQQQTSWNADQLRGRCKRWQTLPARPSEKDIEAVALKLLPGADRESIKLVVGYAIASKLPFPALTDAIDEATALVQREGREEITFEDLDKAIVEYAAESFKAMARSFNAELSSPRARRKPPATEIEEPAAPRADFVPSPAARRARPATHLLRTAQPSVTAPDFVQG